MKIQRLLSLAVFAAVALGSASCGSHAAAPTAPATTTTSASLLGPTAVLGIKNGTAPALVGLGGTVQLDATGSLGANLKYRIAFDDGQESTEAVATHQFQSAGLKTEKLTVTDAEGRSSSIDLAVFVASPSPTPTSVWAGASGGQDLALVLSQAGPTLNGTYNEGGATGRLTTVSGSIAGDRRISLRSNDGVTLDGTYEWSRPNCQDASCVVLRLSTSGSAAGGLVDLAFIDSALPVARLNVADLGAEQLAVYGLPVTFDSSASTGVGLSFDVTYNDGAHSSQAVATRADQSWGKNIARLTIRDRFGRSSNASVTYGVLAMPPWGPFVSTVADDNWFSVSSVVAGKIAGSFVPSSRNPITSAGPFTGTITAPAKLSFALPGGVSLTGGFARYTSTFSPSACQAIAYGGIECAGWQVTIHGGPRNGETVFFVYHNSY